MTYSIARQLTEARRSAVQGRDAELAIFSELLAEDGELRVLWIHAIGGMGKTTLLDAFADRAASGGWAVERIEASELSDSTAQSLSRLSTSRGRTVWLIDGCEELGAIERDLFRRYVPHLPATSRLVLAGRRAPSERWRRDPAWRSLLMVHELAPLAGREARAVLDRGGVPQRFQPGWIAYTRGHPLALALASEHSGEAPTVASDAAPGVVASLLDRFVDGIPGPLQRDVLIVAALVRAVSLPVLREVVGGADVEAAFDWLGALTFVRRRPDGLVVHDLARDVITADARWRDPERFRALRTAIHRHLVSRLRDAPSVGRFVDLQFMTRHSEFNAGLVDTSTELGRYEDDVRDEDVEVLATLVMEVEGARSAQGLRSWLDRQRDNFRVFRSEDGIAGFMGHLRIDGTTWRDRLVLDDPILSATRRFIADAAATARDGDTSVLRWWIQRGAIHRPGPVQNLIQARALFDWARMNARWSVVPVSAPDRYRRHFAGIGFTEYPDYGASVGGHAFVPFIRDWKQSPFWSWLEGAAPLDASPRDPSERAAVAEAVRVALRVFGSDTKLASSTLARMLKCDDAAAIRQMLRAAIRAVGSEPRGADLRQILEVTFLCGCPGQEAAAERLQLAFGTYRHRLRAAEALLIDRLRPMLRA